MNAKLEDSNASWMSHGRPEPRMSVRLLHPRRSQRVESHEHDTLEASEYTSFSCRTSFRLGSCPVNFLNNTLFLLLKKESFYILGDILALFGSMGRLLPFSCSWATGSVRRQSGES